MYQINQLSFGFVRHTNTTDIEAHFQHWLDRGESLTGYLTFSHSKYFEPQTFIKDLGGPIVLSVFFLPIVSDMGCQRDVTSASERKKAQFSTSSVSSLAYLSYFLQGDCQTAEVTCVRSLLFSLYPVLTPGRPAVGGKYSVNCHSSNFTDQHT